MPWGVERKAKNESAALVVACAEATAMLPCDFALPYHSLKCDEGSEVVLY
jgi:hypothetical protein